MFTCVKPFAALIRYWESVHHYSVKMRFKIMNGIDEGVNI